MYKLIVLFVAVFSNVHAVDAHTARVALLPDPNFQARNVHGILQLVQASAHGPVVITGNISGLTEGFHGFHVHTKGDISNGCASAGPHFNPYNLTHGAPENAVRHVGDLGNIHADSSGTAVISITDSIISLSGPNSVVGRAIVVHSGEDDLGKGNTPLSATTGNSGDRWACGVIRIA